MSGKVDEQEIVNLGIESVIMSAREALMEYFKGEYYRAPKSQLYRHLVTPSKISFSSRSGNYVYMRRAHDIECPTLMYVHEFSIPLFMVRKEPERLSFFPVVTHRSKEVEAIRYGIEDFMNKYLQGVTIDEDEENSYNRGCRDGNRDREFMIAIGSKMKRNLKLIPDTPEERGYDHSDSDLLDFRPGAVRLSPRETLRTMVNFSWSESSAVVPDIRSEDDDE